MDKSQSAHTSIQQQHTPFSIADILTNRNKNNSNNNNNVYSLNKSYSTNRDVEDQAIDMRSRRSSNLIQDNSSGTGNILFYIILSI